MLLQTGLHQASIFLSILLVRKKFFWLNISVYKFLFAYSWQVLDYFVEAERTFQRSLIVVDAGFFDVYTRLAIWRHVVELFVLQSLVY